MLLIWRRQSWNANRAACRGGRPFRFGMDRIGMPCRIASAVLLITTLLYLPVLRTAASAGGPEGVWLIDSKVAVQIFNCRGLVCGRVVWLRKPHDPAGGLVRDLKNPDPALRQRLVCGLTVFWALQPSGPNEWKGGWFYNPDDI
jgi:uncharacterized protein (DUF2147 family)